MLLKRLNDKNIWFLTRDALSKAYRQRLLLRKFFRVSLIFVYFDSAFISIKFEKMSSSNTHHATARVRHVELHWFILFYFCSSLISKPTEITNEKMQQQQK